jgi:hypothetical protein
MEAAMALGATAPGAVVLHHDPADDWARLEPLVALLIIGHRLVPLPESFASRSDSDVGELAAVFGSRYWEVRAQPVDAEDAVRQLDRLYPPCDDPLCRWNTEYDADFPNRTDFVREHADGCPAAAAGDDEAYEDDYEEGDEHDAPTRSTRLPVDPG